MEEPVRGTSPVIPDRPSAARMYDYFLGGFHNFAVDREAAERVKALYPDVPKVMAVNRAFLRRAVRFLLDSGIDQFLDLGSGIATVGSVHELASASNPDACVVYVDNDPVAVEHTRALLAGNPSATIIEADARDIPGLLAREEVRRLLDLSRPVGVLLVALLHFVTDDDEACGMIRALRDALAPGSYVAVAHATLEDVPEDLGRRMARLYENTSHPTRARSRRDIETFLAGLSVVDPGVVPAPLWQPESDRDLFLDEPTRSLNIVGVGMVPRESP